MAVPQPFRLFRTPAFIVVSLVMLAAAVALNGTVQALGVHFRKERVELRRPLDALPARLGPWVQALRDKPMPPAMEHALGTKSYIERWYVDSRRVPARLLDGIARKSSEERDRILNTILNTTRDAAVSVHLAYYTGAVDTVAHVPERCYVGGGFDPENPSVVTMNVGTDAPRELRLKYVEFRKRDGADQPKRNVAYFFKVNGDYEYDSATGVRPKLQNLFEPLGYYCKFELMTYLDSDQERARQVMADFLTHAMPEAEKLLPDWQAAKAAYARR
jgi:hypothetical protein